MLYTAKCFWPGVSESQIRRAVALAEQEAGQADFQGALYFPGDELLLALFESPSRVAVKRASELAGMPCERVIESVWAATRIPTNHTSEKGASGS